MQIFGKGTLVQKDVFQQNQVLSQERQLEFKKQGLSPPLPKRQKDRSFRAVRRERAEGDKARGYPNLTGKVVGSNQNWMMV